MIKKIWAKLKCWKCGSTNLCNTSRGEFCRDCQAKQ